MLYFICRVGSNYGVIDTDDGAIEWVSKDELIRYAQQLEIKGGRELKPTICEISSDKCKWSKGVNIFTSAKSISRSGDSFTLFTLAGKKYKGKVITTSSGYAIRFNINVVVPISKLVYDLFQGDTDTYESLMRILQTKGEYLHNVNI